MSWTFKFRRKGLFAPALALFESSQVVLVSGQQYLVFPDRVRGCLVLEQFALVASHQLDGAPVFRLSVSVAGTELGEQSGSRVIAGRQGPDVVGPIRKGLAKRDRLVEVLLGADEIALQPQSFALAVVSAGEVPLVFAFVSRVPFRSSSSSWMACVR